MEDMPGLGVMPVEVNGEEMLMTEVTGLTQWADPVNPVMAFQPEPGRPHC